MSSTLDFAGYIPPYTLMGGRSDDYLFGSSSGSGNDDGIPGGGACPLCTFVLYMLYESKNTLYSRRILEESR